MDALEDADLVRHLRQAVMQVPDVIVLPPPMPPVPPGDPERDDPAEPDGPEDKPPPVLNRITGIRAGVASSFDKRLAASEARVSVLTWMVSANLALSALVLAYLLARRAQA